MVEAGRWRCRALLVELATVRDSPGQVLEPWFLPLSFRWKLFVLNFYHCNPQSLGWSLIRLSYKEL